MNEHDESNRDDEPLGPRLADAWPTLPPAAGFADRVIAARRARTRRRPRAIAVALITTLLASATSWALWRTQGRADGATETSARTSITLGRRGTAVAEAGSALRYQVDFRGNATVQQARGDVFYRVERGGGFDVTTPLAQIHVTGTCFRLEVIPMNIKQSAIGAALGAAVASAIVVTVYEGQVEVRSARGAVQVGPGEKVTTPEGAIVNPPRFETVTTPEADEPPRQEIERLKNRIAQLEGHRTVVEETVSIGSGDKDKAGEKPDKVPPEKYLDFTREEWADMAARCEVRMQLPPLGLVGDPDFLDEHEATQLGLSSDDRARYNDLLRTTSDEHRTALAAIYRDITGEPGDRLTPMALDSEIRAKSPPSEFSSAGKRFAEERAGITPAQDPAGFSPMDRFVRLQATAWERFESKLSQLVGAQKAQSVRNRSAVVRLVAGGCH